MAPNIPFSTVGGYGGNATLSLDPNTGVAAAQVDTQDGFPVLAPLISAGGPLVQSVVDPTATPPGPFWLGMPEINAILIELRVISQLLITQLGATQLDLEIMRADENWNTNPATGVL